MASAPVAASGLLPAARLPAWCLPADWPRIGAEPAPARLAWRAGQIETLSPLTGPAGDHCPWVMPTLAQAHAHLDKGYTARRTPPRGPGLLAAIEAIVGDKQHWSEADLRRRMGLGLQGAWEAGVSVLRTHIDWPDQEAPLAWQVARALAAEWRGRVALETVALVPLRFFADPAMASAIGARVAASGAGAVLGGFVHTSNWNPQALACLMRAAQDHDLDLDLHIDEELDPKAQGVATAVRLARELGMEAAITFSHACALSAQPEDEALATLDAMARLPRPRMVTLPSTNLLLQDARPGFTPVRRGLTRVHEARARGITVLVGSDNVQDAFCRGGSIDPMEAFLLAVHAAQLDDPFDAWSDTIARSDALARSPAPVLLGPGSPADLVCFEARPGLAWPDLTARRRILRGGDWLTNRQDAPWNPAALTEPNTVPDLNTLSELSTIPGKL